MHWQLWQPGPIERQIDGIKPLLASWEKSSDPAQIRLRAYLDNLIPQLLPLPEDAPLFLQLDVDVEQPERLLRYYDLENYLTPLFGSRWLPSGRFVLVKARKYVGGGSRIAWGLAQPAVAIPDDGWAHQTINAGSGASGSLWKERIRSALASNGAAVLPPGPVCVRLAWRCAAHRSWANLWKPTGDAMGPVLGTANSERPYQLDDDRIVDLELHRNIDDVLGHDVVVGLWWRPHALRYTSLPSPSPLTTDMLDEGRTTMAIEFETDNDYQQWRNSHPEGFVLNTTRPPSAKYMVLHRATCVYISEPLRENEPGGFTERGYTKVFAENVESLRDWVATHGRADRTFSNECSRCRPV